MNKLMIRIRLKDLFKSMGCNKCGAKHKYHLYGYIDCYRCGHTFSPEYEGRFYISNFTDFGLALYKRYPNMFCDDTRINRIPCLLSLNYGDSLIKELNKQLYPHIWRR